MRIDSGADRRSAKRKLAQAADRLLAAFDGKPGLGGIAGQFLPEPDGRGVLKMRAADLHDVVVGLGLFPKRRQQGESSAGKSDSFIAMAADTCMAVGITSLELCSMLT